MTNISQIAKETQIWHMKEAHHPKIQYETNATRYMTRWLSYHGLYIKQNMYIHQSKHGMIHMTQKEIPQESTRKGNKPPSSSRKSTNVAWSRGFVKMSAN
jgi:hypothetical protein